MNNIDIQYPMVVTFLSPFSQIVEVCLNLKQFRGVLMIPVPFPDFVYFDVFESANRYKEVQHIGGLFIYLLILILHFTLL